MRMPNHESGAMKEEVARYESMSLEEYFRLIWPFKWRILAFSLAAGMLAYLITFAFPVLYRASAVIKPSFEEQGKTAGILGTISSLGFAVGGPSKVEDLEVLFKSKDLTIRVFGKYKLWPLVFPRDFDSETGLMTPGWSERLRGGNGEPRPPGNWDAIRAAKERLGVVTERRTGTLMLSFDAESPEDTARIVEYYLEEAKSRLQEEALARAHGNKNFLLGQIEKTIDPLTRDRLYSLFGHEVEKEMLAKNREQFGFVRIDAPVVPDRKSSPRRLLTGAIATLTAFFFACLFVLVRRQGSVPPA